MNSIASRFLRRSETAAPSPAPASDVAKPDLDKPEMAEAATAAASEAVSEPAPSETNAATDAAKPEAKSDAAKSDAAKSDAAKPDAAKPDVQPVVPPSRLVEVEKAKPSSSWPDLADARALLSNAGAYRVPAAAAAAILLALGTGYGLGARRPADGASIAKSALAMEVTTRELRDAHGQIGQLGAELKAVKSVVEGMKAERERSRGEILGKQAQIVDRVERTGQENATRIGRLAEQLDRIEKTQRDAGRQGAADKPADKAEKTAATPVPPAKPNLDVAHTGSIGEPKAEKTDPRKTPLDGYVMRDYDEGYALIETRSGRYIDVTVGSMLPGIGRVEAIERRGRQWVVVTAKGFIGER